MKIVIRSNELNPEQESSKPVAIAELHFDSGLLAGLKLIGFTIFRNKRGVLTVSFPSRSYSVHRERRSFSLLREISPVTSLAGGADVPLRAAILDAYNNLKEK